MWRRGTSPDAESKALGRRGEKFAARWLKRRGYRILHRNHRLGDDEADLIVEDPDGTTIVIVEVKTRSDDRVLPEENITSKKMYRMARLAARLQQSGAYVDRPMRLDAIAIHWPEGGDPDLRHYPNAFDSPF